MAKRKSAKRQSPAVYVGRGGNCSCGDKNCIITAEGNVRIPVTRSGKRRANTAHVCYKQFSRITGIKLKPGEIAKVRITGEIIK